MLEDLRVGGEPSSTQVTEQVRILRTLLQFLPGPGLEVPHCVLQRREEVGRNCFAPPDLGQPDGQSWVPARSNYSARTCGDSVNSDVRFLPQFWVAPPVNRVSEKIPG